MWQALYGAGIGGSGRLPPHLVFSDRDFNESDYEALLALDEGIENRKGALHRRLAAWLPIVHLLEPGALLSGRVVSDSCTSIVASAVPSSQVPGLRLPDHLVVAITACVCVRQAQRSSLARRKGCVWVQAPRKRRSRRSGCW